jgi:hypothetical protein
MAEGVCCKHSVAWVMAQHLTPESTAAFLPDQARSGSSSSSSSQVRRSFCDARLHTFLCFLLLYRSNCVRDCACADCDVCSSALTCFT